MKISRIQVKNFRLLKDFSINLEKDLSLVIGKNNVGKTSLLLVLAKFLKKKDSQYNSSFSYNDFSIDAQKELTNLITDTDLISKEEYETKKIGISLRLVVRYEDSDDLSNVGNTVLRDLDIENQYFCLGFDYCLSFLKYRDLREAYQKAKEHFDKNVSEKRQKNSSRQAVNREESSEGIKAKKSNESDSNQFTFNFARFIERRISSYFEFKTFSLLTDKKGSIIETNPLDISTQAGFKIDRIINFEYIKADRQCESDHKTRVLSNKTAELYSLKASQDSQEENREKLNYHLQYADGELTTVYQDLFDDIVDIVKQYGGLPKSDEIVLSVNSALQEKELLKDNTVIKYNHSSSHNLPETHNGLGYINLISILLEIQKVKLKMSVNDGIKQADINLLFIEEPEAHTHPQLQYIFIKNIKELLSAPVGIDRTLNIQTVLTTHSSHIASVCDFDDIKYLSKTEDNVVAKDFHLLNDMFEGSDKDKYFRFCKQYLTVNRSELLFAEKCICIEGDTERILLPAMMKKYDDEHPSEEEWPLLSQNISIIDTGACADKYLPLFEFLGLKKVMIITDFDCHPKDSTDSTEAHRKYVPDKDMYTTNTCLQYFFDKDKKNGKLNSDDLVTFESDKKVFAYDSNSKQVNTSPSGDYRICYQTKEGGYQARSFEDCFIAANVDFVKKLYGINDGMSEREISNVLKGNSLLSISSEGIKSIIAKEPDFFKAASKVTKKSSFALDILLNSEEKDGIPYSNWKTPKYIEEGLEWLRK